MVRRGVELLPIRIGYFHDTEVNTNRTNLEDFLEYRNVPVTSYWGYLVCSLSYQTVIIMDIFNALYYSTYWEPKTLTALEERDLVLLPIPKAHAMTLERV